MVFRYLGETSSFIVQIFEETGCERLHFSMKRSPLDSCSLTMVEVCSELENPIFLEWGCTIMVREDGTCFIFLEDDWNNAIVVRENGTCFLHGESEIVVKPETSIDTIIIERNVIAKDKVIDMMDVADDLLSTGKLKNSEIVALLQKEN